MRSEDPFTAFEELIDGPKDPYKRILWAQEYLQAVDRIEHKDKIKYNLAVVIIFFFGSPITFFGIILGGRDIYGLSPNSNLINTFLIIVTLIWLALFSWVVERFQKRQRKLNRERERYWIVLKSAEVELEEIMGKHSKGFGK